LLDLPDAKTLANDTSRLRPASKSVANNVGWLSTSGDIKEEEKQKPYTPRTLVCTASKLAYLKPSSIEHTY